MKEHKADIQYRFFRNLRTKDC